MHLAHPPVQPAVGDVTPGFLQLAPGVLQDAADRAIAGGSQCVADARDQLPQARLPGVASGRELATRCSTLTATAWERGQLGTRDRADGMRPPDRGQGPSAGRFHGRESRVSPIAPCPSILPEPCCRVPVGRAAFASVCMQSPGPVHGTDPPGRLPAGLPGTAGRPPGTPEGALVAIAAGLELGSLLRNRVRMAHPVRGASGGTAAIPLACHTRPPGSTSPSGAAPTAAGVKALSSSSQPPSR